MEGADSQGFFHLLPLAHRLTGMGADTAADSGEREGESDHLECFLELPLGDEVKKVLAINAGRASHLAWWSASLVTHFDLWWYLDPPVTGFDIHRVVEGRREGRPTDITWIDIEENMVHAGVPHDGHVYNILAFDPCRSRRLCHNAVQPVSDGLIQDLKPLWIGHRESDPRHDILTVNHLRIHHRGGRYNLTICQIAEVASHRRGSDINSQAVSLLHTPRLNLDDLFSLPD